MGNVNVRVKSSSFTPVKGIAMMLVVITHAVQAYGLRGDLKLLTAIINAVSCEVNGLFFIISGFNHKLKSFKETARDSLSYTIKPYLLTALTVVALLPFSGLPFGSTFRKGLYGSLRFVIGFLFGVVPGSSIKLFGIESYDCSVVHFLLELYIGTVIVNQILKIKKRSVQLAVVSLCFIIGACFIVYGMNLFCLSSGFAIAVPCYYLGWLFKEKKVFEKIKIGWAPLLLGITFFITVCYFVVENIVAGSWGQILVFFTPLAVAFLFCLLGIKMSENGSNIIVRALKRVGVNTPFIICAHCVETVCIPWYYWNKMFSNKLLACSSEIVMRFIIISVVCRILKKITVARFKRNNSTLC